MVMWKGISKASLSVSRVSGLYKSFSSYSYTHIKHFSCYCVERICEREIRGPFCISQHYVMYVCLIKNLQLSFHAAFLLLLNYSCLCFNFLLAFFIPIEICYWRLVNGNISHCFDLTIQKKLMRETYNFLKYLYNMPFWNSNWYAIL